MKRGFLLKAQTKRRGAQNQTEPLAVSMSAYKPFSLPQNSKGGFDTQDFLKLDYGNLTDEQKAIPSDYKSNFSPKELDSNVTEYSDNSMIVTTIPQPVPDDETQCQWILNGSTKAKVVRSPGFPARIPKPSRPNLYEERSTADMGVGLFAKRNIKGGDLIFAERPLVVVPRKMPGGTFPGNIEDYSEQQIKQIAMKEFENLLEFAIARFSSELQAGYRALHNAHTDDGSGPLFGIVRSNGYGIEKLYDGSDETSIYSAICKIGSRINHRCKPNVKHDFAINSFSMQFYAIRDIKAGEQLFYSYCYTKSSLADRQAELAPYGFVCKCSACLNATPETDKLRTTFEAQVQRMTDLMEDSPRGTIKEALKLEKDLINEGLDTEPVFMVLQAAIMLAYVRVGKREESERYRLMVERMQKILQI